MSAPIKTEAKTQAIGTQNATVKAKSRTHRMGLVVPTVKSESKIASPLKRKADSSSADESTTYPEYGHSKNCICVRLDKKRLHENLATCAAESETNLVAEMGGRAGILDLRAQGVIPCKPCCQLLKIVVNRERRDKAHVYEWFFTLINWWDWTAEHKRWGSVFIRIFSGRLGIHNSTHNDAASHVIREDFDRLIAGVEDPKKLDEEVLGCIRLALKVLECILEMNPTVKPSPRRVTGKYYVDDDEPPYDNDESDSDYDDDKEEPVLLHTF